MDNQLIRECCGKPESECTCIETVMKPKNIMELEPKDSAFHESTLGTPKIQPGDVVWYQKEKK